jgi:hypothetical protein
MGRLSNCSEERESGGGNESRLFPFNIVFIVIYLLWRRLWKLVLIGGILRFQNPDNDVSLQLCQ